MQPGQSFGLICYYDENSFIYFGMMQEENERILCVKEHFDNSPATVRLWQSTPITSEEIRLIASCNKLSRSFSYAQSGSEKEIFCYEKEAATYLADEGVKIGKRFTGSAIGVYAYSGNTDKPLTGCFTDFVIE